MVQTLFAATALMLLSEPLTGVIEQVAAVLDGPPALGAEVENAGQFACPG
ncbi:hypothetical protein LWP59_26960 [Amycolatopsis acidiphila]|nr:hypothetical protein [Amycolatopsis acidiphila]UIJ57768.1 hypothetical protein LWP59_26960 [Amycolatopsis acidiphila]GHG87574.1 hypothetical protein GCM10017788_61290 [Amycolatopsis acidiphila]